MQPPETTHLSPSKESKRNNIILFLCIILTFIYRMTLLPHFAGWEESDYGNLAMVRGVFESGFQHYDMNHMPGYYALAGLMLFLTDNTELAAKAAALVPSLIALACGVWLCFKYLGFKFALLFWLIATFQPEFALYSTSALREPSYTCWLMLMLLALDQKRFVWSGVFAALAFTVRFEAPLVLVFVFLWACFTLSPRQLMWSVTPMILAVLGWMGYCSFDHGTLRFWGHASEVNIATGSGIESHGAQWLIDGALVSFKLITNVLPWRMGLGFWLCMWFGLYVSFRKINLRWLSLLTSGLLCVWLGIGAVAQHDPQHNLYWKWMYPLVLPSIMVSLVGLKALLSFLKEPVKQLLLLIVVVQAGFGFYQETKRQIERSQELYAPQVNLARWIESEIGTEEPLIVDNIPACYINRKPNEYRLISWFDIPGRSESEFANYLKEERIPYVLWFEEEWTQAPVVAPFLKDTVEWTHQGVALELLKSDDSYGWRWFKATY